MPKRINKLDQKVKHHVDAVTPEELFEIENGFGDNPRTLNREAKRFFKNVLSVENYGTIEEFLNRNNFKRHEVFVSNASLQKAKKFVYIREYRDAVNLYNSAVDEYKYRLYDETKPFPEAQKRIVRKQIKKLKQAIPNRNGIFKKCYRDIFVKANEYERSAIKNQTNRLRRFCFKKDAELSAPISREENTLDNAIKIAKDRIDTHKLNYVRTRELVADTIFRDVSMVDSVANIASVAYSPLSASTEKLETIGIAMTPNLKRSKRLLVDKTISMAEKNVGTIRAIPLEPYAGPRRSHPFELLAEIAAPRQDHILTGKTTKSGFVNPRYNIRERLLMISEYRKYWVDRKNTELDVLFTLVLECLFTDKYPHIEPSQNNVYRELEVNTDKKIYEGQTNLLAEIKNNNFFQYLNQAPQNKSSQCFQYFSRLLRTLSELEAKVLKACLTVDVTFFIEPSYYMFREVFPDILKNDLTYYEWKELKNVKDADVPYLLGLKYKRIFSSKLMKHNIDRYNVAKKIRAQANRSSKYIEIAKRLNVTNLFLYREIEKRQRQRIEGMRNVQRFALSMADRALRIDEVNVIVKALVAKYEGGIDDLDEYIQLADVMEKYGLLRNPAKYIIADKHISDSIIDFYATLPSLEESLDNNLEFVESVRRLHLYVKNQRKPNRKTKDIDNATSNQRVS